MALSLSAIGFIVLTLVMTAFAIYVVHRFGGPASEDQWKSGPTAATAAVLILWLGVCAGLAIQGVLSRWDLLPPPAVILFVVGLLGTFAVALGPLGKRLASNMPIWLLVGYQAFRIPVELLIHHAHLDGAAPVQLTYTGHNFDIISGILALLLGVVAYRGALSKTMAWGFNLVGIALLITVVSIAVVSTPVFAVYGPEQLNTWVADWPYVWLPTALVTCAATGHVLLTRRLLGGKI